MNKVLLLISASMITLPMLAFPKLPSAKIRVAVSKAIRAGDTNAFAAVLAGHGLHANSVFLSGGYTLLHKAAAAGSVEIVKYLLEQDAAVNVVGEYGHTPLDEATAFGEAEVVALLEQAGATHGEGFRIIAALTSRGDDSSVNTSANPLDADLRRAGARTAQVIPPEDEEVVEQEEIVEQIDLFQAVANNERASVERLLADGADAKARNDAGRLPFHIAVELEHYALAAILLKEVQQDINGLDEKGWTPLNFVIIADDWELVREFIHEGADASVGFQDAFTVADAMQREGVLRAMLRDAQDQ